MNKYLLSAIAISVSAFYSSAQALEIYQLDGSQQQAAAGMPILVSDNGNPIYHHNTEGQINNYIWVDQHDSLLFKGVYFVPSREDAGKNVRLCLIENDNVSQCSNSLDIGDELSPQSSSSAVNIRDFWSLSDTLLKEGEILSSDTYVDVATDIDYVGNEPIEDNDANTPSFTNLYYTLFSGATPLISPTPYQGFEHDISMATQRVSSMTDVTLTEVSEVTLCSSGLASVGENPYYESSSCDSRLVRKVVGDGEWILPPTKDEFESLFSGNDFKSEMVGDIEYVANNRIGVDGDNIVEQYCTSVAGNARPASSAELVEFAESGDFDDAWPGFTNYWTNEVVEGPSELPGITWANTVAMSGSNTIQAAPSETYFGFMICRIDD